MIEYQYRHRVRYRECDPMGYVYHTHYIDYFEAARTEALRDMGLAYRTLEESGVIMPVVDLAVRYRRPSRYDDLLIITTRFEGIPSTRVQIQYEVRPEDADMLHATGHVTLCFVDVERNRPIPAPEIVTDVFRAAATQQATSIE